MVRVSVLIVLWVLTLKNKYAFPTPMGYSDFNLCVGIELDDQVVYVAEMSSTSTR